MIYFAGLVQSFRNNEEFTWSELVLMFMLCVYICVDGTVKRYNKEKKEWGLAQMLPLSKFNDPKNGYAD